MSNPNGIIKIDFKGKKIPICMTLGAVADIETGLGLKSINEIGTLFSGGMPAANDLMVVIYALIIGGGNTDIDFDEMRTIPAADLMKIIGKVTDCMAAAFPQDNNSDNPDEKPGKKKAAPRRGTAGNK